MKRVMVVDDHDLCREGLVKILDAEPDLQVVAGCPDGTDAVDTVDDAHPDVIVMDLQMPGMNGADATREILRRHSHIRIIIVTAAPPGARAAPAWRAGATTCLSKNADCGPIVAAIRA
jgi:two-component system response regulator DegU